MADSEIDPGRLAQMYGERLKELGALHESVQLLAKTTLSTPELLEGIATSLRAGMQYVSDTAVRITWGKLVAVAAAYAPTPWTLVRAFTTADDCGGAIEVVYRSSHPDADEGPFLSEERALIDSIANMLRVELDRRSAAAEVRDHTATLALASSAADLAGWEWSVDDDVVQWSPEMVRLFGDDQSGGRLGASSRIHPEDRERVLESVRAGAADGSRDFDLQFRFLRFDGSIGWIGARGRLVPPTASEPRRVRGVLAEITKFKDLEQGVAQLQKMGTVGRIAAGVAHDFNNVLGVIELNTGELLELLPADTLPRQLAIDIKDATARGTDLTKQLLQLSRKSVVSLTRIDPDAVIRRAESMLKRIVGSGVTLRLDLAANAHVIADPTQLDQIVMNLVVNARDALAERAGEITVSTRTRDVGAVESETARPGRYVVISVADTGDGMSPETKARMFEPFFTTKAEGKGTGLGLSVVLGVVQQGQGFVAVESELGRGSKIHIHLPAIT